MKAKKFLTRALAFGALAGVYCLATAGVSGVMMTAADTSAQARGFRGGVHGGVHVGVRVGVGRGRFVGARARVVGPRVRVGGPGLGVGGHGRLWHGRWWGYGVGPCWRAAPIGFVWICT
jgi:hypothetical protein